MTLGTMTALTLADVSSANESSGSTVTDEAAYGAVDPAAAADLADATPGSTMQPETPTTIVVVRRIHIVSPAPTVPAVQPASAASSAVPIPTAATVPLRVQTFAPKPAVRRAKTKAKPKARVRATRPKARVRKAKPVTRSS